MRTNLIVSRVLAKYLYCKFRTAADLDTSIRIRPRTKLFSTPYPLNLVDLVDLDLAIFAAVAAVLYFWVGKNHIHCHS
jgi:hypothetical protein